jgi:tRNA threonylcarbamoyladenosine biosynthesis protein TsaE
VTSDSTGSTLRLLARTPDETIAHATTLAATLKPGSVVTLRGELGAGKTTFVRGIVRALHGSDTAVGSPTFVFWHRYHGEPPINHLDLYRLEDRSEIPALGLDDAFDPSAVVLVEWPERAPAWLPSHSVEVTITGSGETPREIRIARPAT